MYDTTPSQSLSYSSSELTESQHSEDKDWELQASSTLEAEFVASQRP